MRELLIDVYLDWRNNYLSIEAYAANNGLLLTEAVSLISLARAVFTHVHPEA